MLSENKIAALYVTATRHVRLRRNQKPTFTGWPGSGSGSGSGGGSSSNNGEERKAKHTGKRGKRRKGNSKRTGRRKRVYPSIEQEELLEAFLEAEGDVET